METIDSCSPFFLTFTNKVMIALVIGFMCLCLFLISIAGGGVGYYYYYKPGATTKPTTGTGAAGTGTGGAVGTGSAGDTATTKQDTPPAPVYCPFDTTNTIPSQKAGTDYTKACAEGYTGSFKATCGTDGTWNITENCKRKCTNVTGWTIASGNTSLLQGETATKNCTSSGTITGTCGADGNIAETTNNCSNVTCGANVIYGFPLTYGGNSANSTLCPTGSTGVVKGTCKSDASWNIDTTGCVSNLSKKCPAKTLTSGAILPESINDNQVKTTTCPTGKVGTANGKCNTSGEWSDLVDTCAVRCTSSISPGWFDGMTVKDVGVGEKVTTTSKCPVGFVGTTTGVCKADGTIAQESANCKQKYCVPLQDSSLSYSFGQQTDTGASIITGTCKPGYSGTITGVCTVKDSAPTGGAWGSIDNKCDTLCNIMNKAQKDMNDRKTEYNTAVANKTDSTWMQKVMTVWCPAGGDSEIRSDCINDLMKSDSKALDAYNAAKTKSDAASAAFTAYVQSGGKVGVPCTAG